ncbi:MAG: glycosyltransferase family 1 protein [bacterium]
MKIGIDARFYGTASKGLGRYVSELIAELEKIDDRNEYVVFLRSDNFDQYDPAAPNFRKVRAEYRWYSLREQILFPLFLRRFRLDLMHFTHFNVPLLYRRPFLVTVHDLILLRYPTVRATTLNPLLYRLKFLAYRLTIGSALNRARTILTVSDSTRDDIRKTFPKTNQKTVVVTHCACSDRLASGDRTEKKKSSPQERPYALYVGSAYPHKNLETLIRAFDLFRKRGHEDYGLTLVGGEDYFYCRLKEETVARGLDENVTFFGWASDEQLADLYRNASFYAFPSLYEGFGIPPLEAMANGVPVISSDRSCLPEILGQAAMFFDPEDADAIAAAMGRIADDEGLRRRLIESGRIQFARFSWRDTAVKTLEAYQRS